MPSLINKACKKGDKANKEKIKQIKKNSDLANSIQLSSANFEPLTKKLAVDSDSSFKLILTNKPLSSSAGQEDKSSPNKKDEFELDIKELSLFDSSEDDSNEILLK
jgi:hypothetical protein